jgi:outer membrane lipoprotein SlyB
MRSTNLSCLAAAGILAVGCVSEPSSRIYTPSQARTAYDVHYGEVIDVRVVTIQGEPGILGTWGGASVGRAAGAVGASPGNTSILARAAGGIAGAVAGRAIERKIREDEGLEITVQIDGAGAIAVVQADDIDFEPGDRVRVIRGRDGSARVSAL